MAYIALDEVVYFDVIISNPATGAAIDADSAPTFDVFEEATDTTILAAQSMTKRTSKTGDYRGTFTMSAANGFELGKWYSVVCIGIVGGVTGKCVAMNFMCAAAENTAGYPVVTIKDGTGTGEIDTTSGKVAITDGAISTATFAAGALNAAAIATGAITSAKFAAGAIDAAAIAADAIGASELAADAITEIQSGLATAAALTTVDDFLDTEIGDIQARLPAALTADGNMKSDVLRINGNSTAAILLAISAGTMVSGNAITGTLSTTQATTDLTEATDDHYKNRTIIWASGTLFQQAAVITAYNGTTKLLTFSTLTEAPLNGDDFIIV